jgi:hypothetical protein
MTSIMLGVVKLKLKTQLFINSEYITVTQEVFGEKNCIPIFDSVAEEIKTVSSGSIEAWLTKSYVFPTNIVTIKLGNLH